ncbi:acid-activated periplasmic chaperone HdeB, partial [Escherichia coli]|uniref:acid-activated periplasmic chaperone HdeB n=1 Tax=Escherichia coli TaxID=562 RepID=UPI0003EE7B8C
LRCNTPETNLVININIRVTLVTSQEFIDLNPKAMTPVAWWMLHEETVYKGGDTVTLNETDLTQIPKVIEYCKKNPQKNLYTFKNQASNDLPN